LYELRFQKRESKEKEKQQGGERWNAKKDEGQECEGDTPI
jgi:hypothetical protein